MYINFPFGIWKFYFNKTHYWCSVLKTGDQYYRWVFVCLLNFSLNCLHCIYIYYIYIFIRYVYMNFTTRVYTFTVSSYVYKLTCEYDYWDKLAVSVESCFKGLKKYFAQSLPTLRASMPQNIDTHSQETTLI